MNFASARVPFVSVYACALAACAPFDQRLCDEIDRASCDRVDPQTATLARYRAPDVAHRPVVGTAIDARTLVVSVIDQYANPGVSNATGTVFVQQYIADPGFTGCVPVPDGGHVCGTQLRLPSVVPAGSHLLAGDIVNVTGGTYEEFDCTPCCADGSCRFAGRTLSQFSQASVERVGSAIAPAPIDVTAAQVLAGGDAYTGVLVRVTDEITLPAADSRGEFVLAGTGTNTLNLASDLAPLVDPATGAPLARGTRLRNVVGVVSYFYSQKLLARTSGDYEIVR